MFDDEPHNNLSPPIPSNMAEPASQVTPAATQAASSTSAVPAQGEKEPIVIIVIGMAGSVRHPPFQP